MAPLYFDPKKQPMPADPTDPLRMNNTGPEPAQQTDPATVPPGSRQTSPEPAQPQTPPPFYDPRPGTTTGPAPAAPQAPPAAPAAPAAAAPPTPDPYQGGGQYFANTGQWVPTNNAAAIAAATAANAAAGPAATHGAGGPEPPAPIAPPGTAPPPTTAPPATAPAAPTDPNAAAYQTALLKMLGDSQTPASLGDAALKNQSDAYAVGQSRSLDQARSAMAERAAAEGSTGTSSGAFDQGLAGLYGQQGENQAGYNANLVGQANQQKLTQMQNALTMMGNDVNSAEGRALQGHIADMQAQIQRDQLTQQNSQFGQSQAQQLQESQAANELQKLGITTQGNLGAGDLALRQQLGSGQLNLGLLQALMGNQQFGQNLGAQLGMFSSGQNQQALLQMLGMM